MNYGFVTPQHLDTWGVARAPFTSRPRLKRAGICTGIGKHAPDPCSRVFVGIKCAPVCEGQGSIVRCTAQGKHCTHNEHAPGPGGRVLIGIECALLLGVGRVGVELCGAALKGDGAPRRRLGGHPRGGPGCGGVFQHIWGGYAVLQGCFSDWRLQALSEARESAAASAPLLERPADGWVINGASGVGLDAGLLGVPGVEMSAFASC